MSKRRFSFAASAVTASLVTTLLTAPFATAQVSGAEDRTVNATMSCQHVGKNGVSVQRVHKAPETATTRYPSEVAPGEEFFFEYQPGEGTIARQGNEDMWIGRMKYDITLPRTNATIGQPKIDVNTGARLSGWPSGFILRNWHSTGDGILAERLNSQGDIRDADGDILRIWGKDRDNDNRYTPHNSGGNDANVGIGVGTGANNQSQALGQYRLPKVTVPVTAGQSVGQDIVFGFRGAGTPDLAVNNQTYRQPNNTLAFMQWDNQVTTLCRPTDDVPLATIKVVEPYSPEFTLEVTGDEAAGSQRTATATIPNNEVTGSVTFVAKHKTSGEEVDLGTGEIADGKATATKALDNPGDYVVTATLTSPREVYNDSVKTADITVTAADSNVKLVDNQSLTVDVPGDVKATVAPGAQGTITISDGTNSWTTQTINADGTATVPNVKFDSSGDKNVTVSFAPAANSGFAASENTGSIQVNEKQDSTLELSPSKTDPKVNEAITLTAKVTPAEAKGKVQFKDGDTVLATENLNANNEATHSYTPSTEGAKTITAVFIPAENSTFKGDTKTTELDVQPVAQDTGISLDVPATAKATDNVTLKATVDPTDVPGTVEFFNGTERITGTVNYNQATGEATLTAKLPAGTHNITATFTPDDTTAYNGQTSEATQLVVSNVATQVKYTGDTSGKPNEAVTLRASVQDADGNPVNGGSVRFKVGTPAPVTAEVNNGVAEVPHTFPSAGTRNVTAEYVPAADSGYTGNSATAVPVAIKDTATTTLTPSKTDPIVGEQVTLTAKVSPAQAAGQVQFKDGDTILATKDLTGSNNEATYEYTPESTDEKTITAVYVPANNSNYTAGDAASATITPKAAEQTTITVAANPTSGTTDDKITLTATVPAGVQGTVQFLNNGQPLDDEQSVTNGTATLTTQLPEGDNRITAAFTSDNENAFTNATVADADAATVNITAVAPEATAPTVTVTAPTEDKTTDDEITLTAKVDPASAGTVEFFNGTDKIDGTVNYDAATGEATLTTKLAEGDYTVTATFTPADDNTTSLEATSQPAAQFTVKKKEEQQPPAPEATAPAVTVTAPTGDTTTDDEVTLTAKVDPASAGTVEFFNGTDKIDGTVNYDPATGEATLTTKLAEGDYTVTAKFTPATDNTTAKEATSQAAPTFTVKKKEEQQPPAPEATAPAVTVTAPTGDTTTDDEVTLTAKVDPASAGTVEFFNGTTSLGTATVNNGTATLTKKLAEGDYTVTAKFTPATDNTTAKEATSEAAPAFTVKKKEEQQPPAPEAKKTELTLQATENAKAGDTVTVTATIDQADAEGTVEFFNGTQSLGKKQVTGGTATATFTPETAGTHEIKAVFTPADATKFVGDEKTTKVDVAAVTPPVTEGTVPAVEKAEPVRGEQGKDTVLTARVKAGTQGRIKFTLTDGTEIGSATINPDGTATINYPFTKPGAYAVQAYYVAPDGTVSGEASDVFTVTVAAEEKTGSSEGPSKNEKSSIDGPNRPWIITGITLAVTALAAGVGFFFLNNPAVKNFLAQFGIRY